MTDQNIAQAVELAPLIERVHGENHPELTRVRELTLALPDADDPRQAELFKQLRNVTRNYTVPDDACEAFTGTYQALERADPEHVTRAGAVFAGLDVGKNEHHACALDPGGARLHDKVLPRSEAQILRVLTGYQPKAALVVVDQRGLERALAVTVARDIGILSGGAHRYPHFGKL